jgi:hypothetical protein
MTPTEGDFDGWNSNLEFQVRGWRRICVAAPTFRTACRARIPGLAMPKSRSEARGRAGALVGRGAASGMACLSVAAGNAARRRTRRFRSAHGFKSCTSLARLWMLAVFFVVLRGAWGLPPRRFAVASSCDSSPGHMDSPPPRAFDSGVCRGCGYLRSSLLFRAELAACLPGASLLLRTLMPTPVPCILHWHGALFCCGQRQAWPAARCRAGA